MDANNHEPIHKITQVRDPARRANANVYVTLCGEDMKVGATMDRKVTCVKCKELLMQKESVK